MELMKIFTGLQVAALLYRKEEPDLFMVLSNEKMYPDLSSTELKKLFPVSETSSRDVRLVNPRLTSDERNQLFLSRKLSASASESGLGVGGRNEQRYVPKYAKDSLTKRVGDSENMVPQGGMNEDTRPLPVRSYGNVQQRLLETRNPEYAKDYYKTTEMKKSPASFKEDEDTYDIKTLAKIIKNLREEKKDEEEDTRIKGRTPSRMMDTKQPVGSGGKLVDGQTNFKQKYENNGFEAKEHIVRLLDELDRLETLGKVQEALGSEESAGYFALKQELAEDARALRIKVRQALRALQ